MTIDKTKVGKQTKAGKQMPSIGTFQIEERIIWNLVCPPRKSVHNKECGWEIQLRNGRRGWKVLASKETAPPPDAPVINPTLGGHSHTQDS